MSQPHVAILDDEAEIRRILADALGEAGFRTSTYSRATEFEAALKRTTPDVCLVDLGLPDRDGLALVHRLALESGATIIIISGRAALGDRVTGLELGADDYIIKPFEPAEAVARVGARLRTGRAAQGGAVRPLSAGWSRWHRSTLQPCRRRGAAVVSGQSPAADFPRADAGILGRGSGGKF